VEKIAGAAALGELKILHGFQQSLQSKHWTSVREQNYLRRYLYFTAAYDTFWHLGLHLKLSKIPACQPMVNSSWNCCTRDLLFYAPAMDKQWPLQNQKRSRTRICTRPLYNIYTADFPETSATRSMYAVDVALIVSTSMFREAELIVSSDICCQQLPD